MEEQEHEFIPKGDDSKQIVSFGENYTDSAIALFTEKALGLSAETTEKYNELTGHIATVRTSRTSMDKVRVKLKKPALDYCRAVESEFKKRTDQLLAIEGPMKAIKKAADDIKAKKKQEREDRKLEAERIEQERVLGITFKIAQHFNQMMPAELVGKPALAIHARLQKVSRVEILENDYQEFIGKAREEKAVLVQRLKDLYKDTHDNEEADEKRKIEEAALALQKEELEREQAELAAAKDKQDREAEAERKRIAAEDRRQAQVEKDRVEAIRKAEDEKAQAAFDEEQRIHQAEQEEIRTAELAEKLKAEAKRLEEIRPDIDKIKTIAQNVFDKAVDCCAVYGPENVVAKALVVEYLSNLAILNGDFVTNGEDL